MTKQVSARQKGAGDGHDGPPPAPAAAAAEVRAVLVGALARLQAEYRRLWPAHVADCPGERPECASCAMREYTNGAQGQDRTAMNLLAALMTGAPFYCHHGATHAKGKGWQVDPKTGQLCVGWYTLFLEAPDARALAFRVLREAMGEAWGAMPALDSEAAATLEALFIDLVAG